MSSGVTLVELLVVVAILGLVSALAGVGVMALEPGPRPPAERLIAEARTKAILSGSPVTVVFDSQRVRCLPDGHVIVDAPFVSVDPLTGR